MIISVTTSEHRIRIWPTLVKDFEQATKAGFHYEEKLKSRGGGIVRIPFKTEVLINGEKKHRMIECVFFQVDEEAPKKLCKP